MKIFSEDLNNYREVTKEEFYGEIFKRKLDVVIDIKGRYPYTSFFKDRKNNFEIFGIKVSGFSYDVGILKNKNTRFFIREIEI